MQFQWYPGHMTKAKRAMQEDIKLIDVIIELVDSRVPYSSKNPDIDQLANGKSRILLMNKYDLADPVRTDQWVQYYEQKGYFVAKVNSKNGKGVKAVHNVIQAACKEKIERDRRRGILNRPIRAMIVGIPNVGKSTLMNQLIGQKIAITSNKPQTTRNRIQTVLTTDDGQIVFVDTPGIHKAKNKLGEYMVNVAERTLNEVDVVLWLVEPTTFIGAGEQHIISQLKKVKTPVVLVINKIDSVKKEEILPSIAAYKDVYDFVEIVPVSARNGDNTDELVKVIMKYLPYGPQFYDEDTITDQPERQIVAELIREKALHCLQEEIPHGIAVAIDSMKVRNKVMHIDATIICERDSHKGIIIGKKGSMLKKIGSTARYEIEKMLDQQVNLKLWVKVKKDWRDSEFLMKNFGYREDE